MRMRGVGKRLGGEAVLTDVHLELHGGEVVALAGEDGAGKSTLLKILCGIHTDYEGVIEIQGQTVRPRSPLEANHLGVAVIHQGLSLIPAMTVADNLFLGRSLTTRAGFVADRAQRLQAQNLLDDLRIPLQATDSVEELSTAQRQLVEVVKAVALDATIIALDEPANSLTESETRRLFELMAQLRARNCGLLYATRRLDGFQQGIDRVLLLQGGRCTSLGPVSELLPGSLPRQFSRQTHRSTVEEERARIARSIHDDLGARLTQISLLCELGSRQDSPPAEVQARFRAIADTTREVAEAMDAIVWAINPRNDSLENLASYLAQFAENFLRLTSIRCRLDVPPDLPDLPLSTEARHSLFLAVRESLNNAIRHSHASEVWLRVKMEGENLTVEVQDNGVGFQTSAVPATGNGLPNLKSRMAELGGVLELESMPSQGTRLRFCVPTRSRPSGAG